MKYTILFALLVLVSCGGPNYPDQQEQPPQPGVEIPPQREVVREDFPDTLKYMSDVNITYYKEIRPFTFETNDSTIIVDGLKFQIVDTKRTEKGGKTVLSFHVVPYSGLFTGTNLIMVAYNEDDMGEVAIPPFGIFSTQKPDQWTLKEKQVTKTPSRKTKTHIVGTGQNLSGVSKQYGMTVNQIQELNNMGNRTRINVGQKLKVYAD